MRVAEKISINKYNTVSIIGLAKNAGKTVTLNYLIDKMRENNIIIGITSTGRDGESIDIVTNTNKPSIFVSVGTYIATAKKALMLSNAKVEILETTGIMTPMGEVIIVKVRQEGNIQIAGPVSTSDIRRVCHSMSEHGAKIVFVDGAIDRRATSSPIVTDACIIATGAVLSRDMKKVIEKTAFVVECYSLLQIKPDVKNIISTNNHTCIIQSNGKVIYPNIKTGITGGKEISELIDLNTTYVYVKGAITTSLLMDISQNKYLKNFKLVIDDGTKIFVEIEVWKKLKRKGLIVQTFNSINVLAIALNPVSPMGYYFDSTDFKHKMKHYLPNIKIIDVISGGE